MVAAMNDNDRRIFDLWPRDEARYEQNLDYDGKEDLETARWIPLVAL